MKSDGILCAPGKRRYPELMATRKINLPLDEELVRRAREQDVGEGAKSDAQVVEDALSVMLGLRALDEARAQGTLAPEAADELAVAEVRAARRAHTPA
jgi:hypothetical protein